MSKLPDTSEVVEKLLRVDVMTFGQMFFGKHFLGASPEFHYRLIRAAQEHQFLAVASPRKSAKSTLLSFLFPFHQIMFKTEPFIVLISNTFKKAAMYLDSIKMELADNLLLRQTFPKVDLERDAEGDTIFRHPNGFRTLFLCKGVDQIGSLRGVKFGPHRPGIIIIDDMEDDKLVKNPDLRKSLQSEFDEVLGRVGHATTKFIVVGTILHDDSQLAKLLRPTEYTKFHKIVFRAHINPDSADEKSIWEDALPLLELKRMRREEPTVYAKEMQNDPAQAVNAKFSRDQFKYWRRENDQYVLTERDGTVIGRGKLTECKAAISCDLAWKEKREADFCVLLPAFLTPDSNILIDTYVCEKGLRPDEIAENLFLLEEKLRRLTNYTVPIGFEKAMLENVTQWILKKEMRVRNQPLVTKELKWDTDKITRIETRLQPRYAQGMMFHRHGMGELELQLERFPYGTHDDLVDAAQGLVQLLKTPKDSRKPIEQEDSFMWWQKKAMEYNNPKQFNKFKLKTKRSKFYQLPAKVSWR